MATSANRPLFSSDPISPECARAAIDRVLASQTFQGSDTLSRFLRHITDRKIEGKVEGLKEYTLGVDVLGRSESFDPRIDSIVRVEASRLRARLKTYYETTGADDPIRIELPRGSYIPGFRKSIVEVRPAALGRRYAISAAAVLIVLSLIAGWSISGKSDPGPVSVAVLPFVNLSTNGDERFVDGITSEVISALAGTEGVRVVARSSVFQYKGRNLDVRRIGRQLNVAAVVEGTVRREGDAIRITAQLAGTKDGFHRWHRNWEGSLEDSLGFPEDIARGVTHALQVPPPGDAFVLKNRGTTNPDAYRSVIEARYLTPTTPQNAAIRIAHYRSALRHEPAYAAAWVGMADTWARLAGAAEVAPHDVMKQARQAAQRALQLDSTIPDAHLLLAAIQWTYDWDWPAADREFRRAIQLDPDSPTIRTFYAQYLSQMGRSTEALEQVASMRTLKPLSPASRTIEAQVFYLSRQYDQTIRLCQTILAAHPNIWGLRYWLARAYGSTRAIGKSVAILKELHPPGALEGRGFGMLGAAYATAGRPSDAATILDRATERAKQRYVSPVSIAQIYIGLGEYDRAFEWLERGFQDRDSTMATLKVEPAFDPIRPDPRFLALLQRMKLL